MTMPAKLITPHGVAAVLHYVPTVALFISVLAGSFTARAVDCVTAPPGLISWWAADGNSLDLVGTNHGYMFGGVTATNGGYSDRGFRFDGTNGFIAVSNNPSVNLANLTVECWVRFDLMDTPGTSTAGAQYIVFKKNTRSGNFEGINLSKHRYTNSDIIVWEATSSAGQFTELRSKTVLQQGVWYHLAGVRGPNYLSLYVNGVMEASNTVTYPQDYDSKALLFGSSGEFYWEHKLAGMLDEVGLFNRALTDAEIQSIYAAGAAGKCKPTAPNISTQPTNLTVVAGSPATFNVAATGGGLNYQWRMYSTNLPGQLTNSLIIPAAQLSHAGDYTVVVSNAFGMITSSVATLTVLLPPNITTQPTNQTVIAGNPANFSVTATGPGLAYQWRFNTTNILAGKTTAALNIPSAQTTDAGNYTVVITNTGGSVTSDVATLTVLVPPNITSQPTNQTVIAGSAANFTVAATGPGLTYQWRFNTTNILAGKTTATLTLPAAQTSDAGSYSVVITNTGGTAISDAAALTVLVPPFITAQPAPQTVLLGDSASFSVTADGTGPLTYQWKFNTTNLAGQTLTSLTLSNVQAANAGGYSVLVTGPGGTTNSAAALLSPIQHPVLLSPAGSPGNPFAFTVSGDAGHTYAIEVTTNFVDWTQLTTVSNATGQVGFQDSTTSNQFTRYYRARFVQ